MATIPTSDRQTSVSAPVLSNDFLKNVATLHWASMPEYAEHTRGAMSSFVDGKPKS